MSDKEKKAIIFRINISNFFLIITTKVIVA